MPEESPEMLALRDTVARLKAENAGLRGGNAALVQRATKAETRLVETENKLAALRVQMEKKP